MGKIKYARAGTVRETHCIKCSNNFSYVHMRRAQKYCGAVCRKLANKDYYLNRKIKDYYRDPS